MSFYNTGNPVPSIDPRDLDDNAKNIDEIVNSESPTFVDRLGAKRITLAGIVDMAGSIGGQVEAAQVAADQSEAAAERSESAASLSAAFSKPFPTISDGLANTLGTGANNRFFSVPSIGGNNLSTAYRNDSGVAVVIGQAPSASVVQTLESDFRKVVTHVDYSDLLISISDTDKVGTWLQARTSDGGPSELSKSLLREGIPGLPEIADVPDTGVSIQDERGIKTWLQTSSTDGGLTPLAAEFVRKALDLPSEVETSFVADGDSMTASAYGGGVPYTTTLATLLGKPVINVGISGTTAVEVAIRAAGVIPLLTISGGSIPAGTDPVTITWDVTGSLSGSGQPTRAYSGKVRGVPCSLKYSPTAGVLTLNRLSAGIALPVGSPVPFIPDSPYVIDRHIVWAGRNDYPKSGAYASLDKLVSKLEFQNSNYLLVSVCNTTSEPAGSAGYEEIAALNLQLLKRSPESYVDMRGRMIREGLALAGVSPTTADTTAISEDRIPPSLLEDGLHFNISGRLACAKIIYDELLLRNME